MISRCGLLRRREDMVPAEFARIWKDVHGPIGARAKNLISYSQNLVIDNRHLSPLQKSGLDYDGISELQFESFGDMAEGMGAVAADLADDYATFGAGDIEILVCVKKCDSPRPAKLPPGALKRISLIRRREEVSPAEFQHEWWDVHSRFFAEVPGYVGYSQNLVVQRSVNGADVSRRRLPIDGMVEMWFETTEALDQMLNSSEYEKAACHASRFIAAISTYLIDERDVVSAASPFEFRRHQESQ